MATKCVLFLNLHFIFTYFSQYCRGGKNRFKLQMCRLRNFSL